MKRILLFITTLAVLVPVTSFSEEMNVANVAAGKSEFVVACASCHGESGKGNGDLANILEIETPNLTTITKRTGGGEFPFRNTLLIIDGRKNIRAHGGEMPVWGDRYFAAARAFQGSYGPMSDEAAEMVALGRMTALVYYLESIQE
jgi:mono/diheme cytochrome c family protein